MKIIKIEPNENGGHANQSGGRTLPEGWAVVPDDMECENFPFGDIVVEEIDGVPTVVEWIPRDVPEPESTPEPEPTEATTDDLAAAILEGVNGV